MIYLPPDLINMIYTNTSPLSLHMFDTVDVFSVFQVSPDDTQYLSVTSPVTPPASAMVLSSPIPPNTDCLPPGVTRSFDSVLDCQSLLEQATDL